MRVLVTGGAGYIGSHACKALSLAGHDPIVFDNLSRGNAWAVKWGQLCRGDLLSYSDIKRTLEMHRPDVVMHFAGMAYVGESHDHPDKYYSNNIIGTYNLLEAMRFSGITKMVFSSSCAVYGVPDKSPIAEGAIKSPINPYGFTKLACEKMLHDYDVAFNVRSISLRYFNAAGADAGLEIGEFHSPETHLIPIILETALGLREKVTVNGGDFLTPDGTCIRDYIHVMDLAAAHVIAGEALQSGHMTTAFNLGNGTGKSILDVIKTCENITGIRIPYEISNRRPGDPPILVGDASQFIKAFDWKLRNSSFDNIIATAWRWLRKCRALD